MAQTPPSSSTLELTQALIARPSVTPDDAGCQDLLTTRLAALGFQIEKMPYGEVSNFWARLGKHGPLFAFAGHTDVVPSGPLEDWTSPPFSPEVRDGMLYGRGAADMKGSLAAMLTACERFLAACPTPRGSIAWLITSDEEGPSVDGTVKVMQRLAERGEKIDWCLVGEPSSSERVGDIIKNGRRGSLNGHLTIRGKQGHIAYPQLALNPVHAASTALAELCAQQWDSGNEHFPPTSLQISNIHAGTGAENVIPGSLKIDFNFRFSTASTASQLQARVEDILRRHQLNYTLDWRLSGEPFLTAAGELVDAVRAATQAINGTAARLSTAGGTSDGRFIAPHGAQVVELGPVNASIHQVNECVECAALDTLSRIYEAVLHKLLG